jgi:uncharacterized protein with von Willebrand factor type A (vWA) domain
MIQPQYPPRNDGDRSYRTYSDRELLRHKNFAEMSAEETEAVQQMMAHLLWKVSERRTRRKRPGKGHLIEVARSAVVYVRRRDSQVVLS